MSREMPETEREERENERGRERHTLHGRVEIT